jgi:hypothetical protein
MYHRQCFSKRDLTLMGPHPFELNSCIDQNHVQTNLGSTRLVHLSEAY